MSTIAAIGTALGNSGISIIRISGENSKKIIDKIFTNSNKLNSNTIHYGKIIYNNEVIDNVLVSYFKAPNSFTGEDICEINCHGGSYITQKILDIVLKSGAELAMPGEFSKRAFLNGKMDLSEAEGVIDLINAKTNLETKIANNQLNGILKDNIIKTREKIIEILAHIDVNVDYPEYDYEQLENNNIISSINVISNEIKKLIDSYEQGKIIKNGVNVAILGKPNSGKSSLLNILVGDDRAIVTDIEGTTRDVITETINIGDIVLNLSDTAGIRETENEIEKIGVEKSLAIIENVDLIIYMFDPAQKVLEEEKKLLSKIQNKGIKIIYLINKMDKYEKTIFDTFLEKIKEIDKENIIKISTKDNIGIEDLKNKIKELFLGDKINNLDSTIIVNQRHKFLLDEAYEMLMEAKNEIDVNMPIDMVSITLKKAAKCLGEIVGLDVSADVAQKVFEKFCIGK